MSAPLHVRIDPFGFTVTEADLDPTLKFRVQARITEEEERRDVLRKLLRNMLLDLDTLSLVSEADLTTEVALTRRCAYLPPMFPSEPHILQACAQNVAYLATHE